MKRARNPFTWDPTFTPKKGDEVIFDFRNCVIQEKGLLTFKVLSALFREWILNHDLVIVKIFYREKREDKFICNVEKLTTKNSAAIKKAVKKHDLILEIFEHQLKREMIEIWKKRNWNLTEEWFETVNEVQPDQVHRKKLGGERLRATFITSLLRNGAPIQAVAKQVGHRSLATTASYAPKLTRGQILKQYKMAHPRA